MKLLIVDDHVVVREGLRRLLCTIPDAEVLEASNTRDAFSEFKRSNPSAVILDIDLDGSSGLEFLRRLRAHTKNVRVIMFSMHADPGYVVRAIKAGAMGFVSKSAPAEELINAVRQVLRGEKYVDRELANHIVFGNTADDDPYLRLSARELEIVRLLGEGKSITKIADTFGVAYKTVANSCSLLKAKLGLERTADLIRLSIERRHL